MKKILIIVLMFMAISLYGCSKENNDPYEGFFDLPDNYKYITSNEGVAKNEDGSFTNVGYYKYEICKYDSNFKLTKTEGETQTMTEAYALNYASQCEFESVEDLMKELEEEYTITLKDSVYTLAMENKTTNYAKLNENEYLWDEYLQDSDDSTKYHFATKEIYKDKETQVETIKLFMEKSTYNEEKGYYEFDISKKDEIKGLSAYDSIEYANTYITNGKLSKFEIKLGMKSDDITYVVTQIATFEEYNEEITLPTDLIYCEHQYKEHIQSITIYDHHFHGYVCTECGNIKDLEECELQDGKCSVCGYVESN